MGFESFRVELRGGVSTHHQADETVRGLPNAQFDRAQIASQGSNHYTVEDGQHVIEIEVASFPVKLSCRFTLCHPRSIDAAFLGLIHELMVRLGMEARICDDVPPHDAQAFPAGRFSEFADIVTRCISGRRAEWVAHFGPEEVPATTTEAYRRFILPMCEPVIG